MVPVMEAIAYHIGKLYPKTTANAKEKAKKATIGNPGVVQPFNLMVMYNCARVSVQTRTLMRIDG
jgi:hypothetical protein